MTTFPGSPRLLKGAIIGLDPVNPLASVVVFQYNPDTLTRRIDARSTGGTDGGDRSEAFRLSGPPRETITLNVEIDAADQLERPLENPTAITIGVYPTLSALEMLLYPKSKKVIADLAAAKAGNIEIIPPEAPMTLFVWGAMRVLPVRITSLSITEEAYDTTLNPIRAKVDLSLYVLSYADLKPDHPGHTLFLVHQVMKEIMATSNVFNSLQNTGSALKIL
jgi:hypothetical protein